MNRPGTIREAEAIARHWDAIVVGAGPAGSVIALQLARQGLSTLLVERHSWPRQKVCGGCLNARAIGALRSLGLERVLANSKTVPLKELNVRSGNRSAAIPLSGGAAIDRAAFDAALVEAAIDAGAQFLPATQAIVQIGEKDEGYRNVSFSVASTRSSCQDDYPNFPNCGVARARFVVAADGLGHPSLRRLPEFACSVARRARIGVSLAIRSMPQSYRPGTISMALTRHGYVGMVRTSCGGGNLAAAIDSTAVRAAGGAQEAAASILTEAGFELPDFQTGERWHGTIPLTRQSRRLSAERIVLLGDATGYVEPFTGEGIGWALASAAAAAPFLVRNLERWDPRSIGEWERLQRREMLHDQAVCRILASMLRRPLAVRVALAALAVAPVLARPFVRQANTPMFKYHAAISALSPTSVLEKST